MKPDVAGPERPVNPTLRLDYIPEVGTDVCIWPWRQKKFSKSQLRKRERERAKKQAKMGAAPDSVNCSVGEYQ